MEEKILYISEVHSERKRSCMKRTGEFERETYNLLDLPQRQTTGEGTVVDYKYAFDGRKLQEKVSAGRQ